MAGLDAILASTVTWIERNLLVDTVRITLPPVGDPVLNETTGQLEYPEGDLLYEGPGAVQGGIAQSEVSSIPNAGQPWAQETHSRYRMMTPLAAPIAPKDAIVTVVEVHNPARADLIGRSWICQDPGIAATTEVVRITALDQNETAGSRMQP
ncbi:DUF6093 family protein [Streptomyces sp. SID161]|uniref:DUF6093 family protein n=1 Tax=Streptomyces sp. SID161 TaxID=2690251 RepID=UPI00136CA68F|nr:DUF6093 family protein [Streptomyces sp. SID161]MYW43053.1 hypothetical protein [Streptomyces sp. SID161]